MKKIGVLFFMALFILAGIVTFVDALPYNVAQGANVTLNGEFFTGGWVGGDVPSNQQGRADTLVDGSFLNKSHQWDQDTVWWDSRRTGAANNSITIDLGSIFSISGFIVQADDNDGYILDYWDGDSWELAWDIPVVGGWGMQTRPNINNNNEEYFLSASIFTDTLRFRSNPNFGDGYFSVSEIQAYGSGSPVPEPGTLVLLGSGLAGLYIYRKKFIKK